MTREWYFDRPAESLLPGITAKLNDAGFSVQWTFDLQAARELAPTCTCPNHDTTRCDCQYMVLLVNVGEGVQETLLVHGHDTHSWIVLATRSGRQPNEAVGRIVQALRPVLPSPSSSREAVDAH